jgi:hypothetical protein
MISLTITSLIICAQVGERNSAAREVVAPCAAYRLCP